MRLLNTLFALLMGISVSITATDFAEAQSSQYKRSSKKTKKTKQTEEKEKVDISDIEKKYWSAKDKNFSVVQNRLYSKKGRFAFTGSLGMQFNDSLSSGGVYQLAANYYLSESMGVELSWLKYDLGASTALTNFEALNGVSPDFNRRRHYMGASFNWVPIYAKMSVLDKKIIYFDMAVSLGMGVVQYQHQTQVDAARINKNAFAFNFDITQSYFLSNHLAIRMDVKTLFYTERIVDWQNGTFQRDSGISSTTVLFGLTYFH